MDYALKQNGSITRIQSFDGDPPVLSPSKGMTWEPYVRPEPTQEQMDAAHNASGWNSINMIEREHMFPRTLREFLLEQPGANQKPWYAKVKQVDNEIAALKVTLR